MWCARVSKLEYECPIDKSVEPWYCENCRKSMLPFFYLNDTKLVKLLCNIIINIIHHDADNEFHSTWIDILNGSKPSTIPGVTITYFFGKSKDNIV